MPTLAVFASEKGDPITLDLDSLRKFNITPQAQFLIDKDRAFSFSSPPTQLDWSPLNRSQLRFGFVDHPVWLKINFKAIGQFEKSVDIEFSKNIDNIQTQLFEDGEQKNFIYSEAIRNKIFDDINSHNNHPYIMLKPGSNYQLLIRMESQNTINGIIAIEDGGEHLINKQRELMWYLAYGIVLLMILIFNSIAYISTKYKAFWFHSIYGVSVLIFQLAQYGYMNSLLGLEDLRTRQLFIIFSLSLIILAILYFINFVLDAKHSAPKFSKLMDKFVVFTSAIMVISVFLPFKYSLFTILGSSLLLAISTLGYLIWAFSTRQEKTQFTKSLAVMFMLLFPPTALLALSRFGLIDQTFVSEYLFLLLSPFEMVLISIILFFHIKQIEKQASTAKYFDQDALLPNKYYLKNILEHRPAYGRKQTLAYIWLSGLTKMQLLLEAEQYEQFISKLSVELNEKISKLKYVQTNFVKLNSMQAHIHEELDGFGLFYVDRNTYAVLINSAENTDLEEIKSVFNTAIKKLQKDSSFHNLIKPIISACNFRDRFLSADTIMQHCGLTLSRCIKTNKDQLIYNDELRNIEHRHVLLASGFSQALKESNFFLQWQPQFDSKTNKICGMESLARWEHPDYGLISPSEFIPLLEDTLQIKELTHWVIRSVFNEVTRIRKYFPDISLSINLSVYDFLDDDLLNVIDHYLSIAPWISSNITLEVTETVMIEDNERILFVVKELQKRGFEVSIDDFGAGYASFGYLQNIPANELKIDRRYTMSCEESNSQAIIKSIIYIAKQLRMKVVVEGIEEQYQADLFKEWGAESLQGWLFSKPVHLREIIKNYT